MPTFKTYQDLLAREDQPPGSTWGLFDDPNRGMAELAGPAEVLRGVNTIRDGRAFSLDYALGHFDPPAVGHRKPPQHTITSSHADQRDDYIDGFWLQASSQIDGLRHRRHHEYGFYNGNSDAAIAVDTDALGVGHWADAPIIGRGVVIDVEAYREEIGQPLDQLGGSVIEPLELDAALDRQGVVLQDGDLVIVNTGWAAWWTNEASAGDRAEISAARRCVGLRNCEETIAWFWDHQVAMAGSDTLALEVLPPVAESTYGGSTDLGLVHQELIALMGLPIGELWRLDALVADCRETRIWDCLLVVKPLALPAGVGSPANAVAIR